MAMTLDYLHPLVSRRVADRIPLRQVIGTLFERPSAGPSAFEQGVFELYDAAIN